MAKKQTAAFNGTNSPSFHARSRKEWRRWLEQNHSSEQFVWLILYRKGSPVKSVTYVEAVEEALCFGWIDSRANKRNHESSYLYFAPRKRNSKWSNSNKERVERLTKQGLMRPAGQVFVDLAKVSGAWDLLTDPQNSVIPEDLEALFAKNKKSRKNFGMFPPSSKRLILEWIANAKKPETRAKRITETVELAAQNIRANHPKTPNRS